VGRWEFYWYAKVALGLGLGLGLGVVLQKKFTCFNRASEKSTRNLQREMSVLYVFRVGIVNV